MPEWNDRVDQKYNFIEDRHSDEHTQDPAKNDSYMWDIFGMDKLPFDGVLVSRIPIEREKKKFELTLKEGIHKVLRLPREFELLGDCGAFGYIDQKVPPYDPLEILEYYKNTGFNYGVSVDHLVVPQFVDQKDERIKITYENGVLALKEWKSKYKDIFQLIVSVQGWEINDYISMYKKYIDDGATHLALGGLVRCPTSYVSELIDKLLLEIRSSKKTPQYIHFFGLARAALFPQLKQIEELGVTVGFDSASYLRKAWLSAPTSEMNYLTLSGRGYTAIRIPFTKKPKTKNPDAQEDQKTQKTKMLEQKCLQELWKYEKTQTDIENVLSALTEFSKNTGKGAQLSEYYKRTLQERPWEKCDCPICKEIGINVVLFRGNNRNRRRGFHNVNVFYKVIKNETLWQNFSNRLNSPNNPLQMLQKGQKVLIITECSKTKSGYNSQTNLPAKNLYRGRLFQKIKQYAQTMSFDYVIISAKYGLVFPDEKIKGYEKMLKTNEDVKEIQTQVENRLTPMLPKYDKILVIAGEKYKDALKNVWDQKFLTIRSRGYTDLCKIIATETKLEKTLPEFSKD